MAQGHKGSCRSLNRWLYRGKSSSTQRGVLDIVGRESRGDNYQPSTRGH